MVICGRTSQIISAAIFRGLGQPPDHCVEYRRFTKLSAKIGRGSRKEGFEHGLDIASTNILACYDDETAPGRIAVQSVNCLRSRLR